jgi:DNA-3-methyladenine glycosylase II
MPAKPSSASPHPPSLLSDPRVLERARRRLRQQDPPLAPIISRVGRCTLRPDPDCFGVLVRSIISQSISTKAALSVLARVQQALSPAGLTPEAAQGMGEVRLRTCGLSTTKSQAILDLAERVIGGTLPVKDLPRLPDDEVVAHLVPVRGIGLWTAQMFLIFSLGRLDVLAEDDLGLRAGIKDVDGLEEMPSRMTVRLRAEVWKPYRTIATWYLWRSRGGVPQSD